MRAIPIRGTDGKIVDFVDPRALQEEAVVEVASPPVDDDPTDAADAEPPVRRTRALWPGERRPLSDLLGGSSTTAQPQRSFTTGMVVGLLGALIVAALIVASRVPASPPTALRSTVSASTSAPTPLATARAVVMAPPTVGRALVAYAAPAGAVVGAINADRAISLTGTFGSDWIQLQTADSGLVWVKQVDLPTSVLDPVALANLPDLAPPPTATALPAPTVAPIARPHAPDAPASAPAATASAPAATASAPVQRCTPDRVVAIVERGVMQVASCVSLADAQSRLPDSTVVAADTDAAQTVYADAAAQATALAQP